MKIAIDIPLEWLFDMKNKKFCQTNSLYQKILNGTPQPKFGWWIKEESMYGWDGYSYQCSACGRSIHLDTEVEDLEDYPYCHCGAKMEAEREE